MRWGDGRLHKAPTWCPEAVWLGWTASREPRLDSVDSCLTFLVSLAVKHMLMVSCAGKGSTRLREVYLAADRFHRQVVLPEQTYR
jgi:hypothetical protein